MHHTRHRLLECARLLKYRRSRPSVVCEGIAHLLQLMQLLSVRVRLRHLGELVRGESRIGCGHSKGNRGCCMWRGGREGLPLWKRLLQLGLVVEECGPRIGALRKTGGRSRFLLSCHGDRLYVAHVQSATSGERVFPEDLIAEMARRRTRHFLLAGPYLRCQPSQLCFSSCFEHGLEIGVSLIEVHRTSL